MDTAWAQLQAYTKTYTSSQPLSPVNDTRAPHVIFFLPSSSSLAERVDGEQQQHAGERRTRPGQRAEDAAGVLLLLARMTVLHDVGGGSPARPLHAVRVLHAPPSSPASRRPRPRRAAQAASSVRRQWRAAAAAHRVSSVKTACSAHRAPRPRAPRLRAPHAAKAASSACCPGHVLHRPRAPHRRLLARVLLLRARVLLLVLAMDTLLNNGRWQEEEGDDIWGPRVSDRERGYNEIYVFVYACSWAQIISIRIMWHSREKRKIIMTCFKIGE